MISLKSDNTYIIWGTLILAFFIFFLKGGGWVLSICMIIGLVIYLVWYDYMVSNSAYSRLPADLKYVVDGVDELYKQHFEYNEKLGCTVVKGYEQYYVRIGLNDYDYAPGTPDKIKAEITFKCEKMAEARQLKADILARYTVQFHK